MTGNETTTLPFNPHMTRSGLAFAVVRPPQLPIHLSLQYGGLLHEFFPLHPEPCDLLKEALIFPLPCRLFRCLGCLLRRIRFNLPLRAFLFPTGSLPDAVGIAELLVFGATLAMLVKEGIHLSVP